MYDCRVRYHRHPHERDRKLQGPIKHDHHVAGFNGKLALWITAHVGTMWCAYLFAVIGLTAIFGALTANAFIVLLIGAISGYFLQLVLLPVIMVGQNLQSSASDTRAEQTYNDAEAVLHEVTQIQTHLLEQDAQLQAMITALGPNLKKG